MNTSIAMGLMASGVPLRLLFDLATDVDSRELLELERGYELELTATEAVA